MTKYHRLHDAASAASPSPPPVLVVDDDPAGALTTSSQLAGAGYPFTAQADGDAVLRLVRTKAVRLVVAELRVPCAEGPCVVRVLKADRTRLPWLRILVHTRHVLPADDARALNAGVDGVLHKPASADSLVREVRRLDGADAFEPDAALEVAL